MTTSFRRSPLALAVLALLEYQPLHPYGVQRLIKQWGKDQVVNVGQRASLYKTMDRLLAAGLIAVRETGRDSQYPERTVYELTDVGREAARQWMGEILAAPKPEFPEFPAALSFIMLLTPEESLNLLEQRRTHLEAAVAAMDESESASAEFELPRVTALDEEYLRAVTEAELRWVGGVIADIRAKSLTWDREVLDAAAVRSELSI